MFLFYAQSFDRKTWTRKFFVQLLLYRYFFIENDARHDKESLNPNDFYQKKKIITQK